MLLPHTLSFQGQAGLAATGEAGHGQPVTQARVPGAVRSPWAGSCRPCARFAQKDCGRRQAGRLGLCHSGYLCSEKSAVSGSGLGISSDPCGVLWPPSSDLTPAGLYLGLAAICLLAAEDRLGQTFSLELPQADSRLDRAALTCVCSCLSRVQCAPHCCSLYDDAQPVIQLFAMERVAWMSSCCGAYSMQGSPNPLAATHPHMLPSWHAGLRNIIASLFLWVLRQILRR